MSFYIRRSVKFGSIRLNFCKSGIGISADVKGAGDSSGPRGTIIHLSRDGVYYRRRTDGSIGDTVPPSTTDSGPNSETLDRETRNARFAEEPHESSSKELLEQINTFIQQPTYAAKVGIASTAMAGAIASLAYVIQSSGATVREYVHPILLALPLVIAAIVWIAGLKVAWITSQQEKVARTTTLQYELDDEAKNRFQAVQNALADLAKSVSVWRVVSQTATWDWKRNAGASSLVTRKPIAIRLIQPPFIETRIRAYGIVLDTMLLIFLPDQILVFQGGKYSAFNYGTLQAFVWPTRFMEMGQVPNDSTVAGSTWQNVNRDGSPDMRFRSNRQIPIVEYGYIALSSQSGLDLHFHISNLAYAQRFAQVLQSYAKPRQESHRDSSSRSSTGYKESSDYQRKGQRTAEPPNESKDDNPYTILGLSSNATREEIAAAYRRLASMNHPDKVAGLAPEFRELAEKRMKAINGAYEQLKRSLWE